VSGGTKRAWVSNLGPGPLVLLRTNLLAAWSGDDAAKSPTDLARARGIRAIGTIPVGIGHALVVGGKPGPTTWIPGATGGLLVRWIAAESEDEVLRAADLATDATWSPTGCRLKARAGDHVLFHASLAGRDSARENIPVRLSTGLYDVTSAVVEEPPTSVVVYRLTWRPEKAR
jgi:hypothetical protein